MAMEIGFNTDLDLDDEIPVSAAFLRQPLKNDPLCDSDPLSIQQNDFVTPPHDPLNGTTSKRNLMVWEERSGMMGGNKLTVSTDVKLKSGAVVELEDIMKNSHIVRTYGLDQRTPLSGTRNMKGKNNDRRSRTRTEQVVIKIEPGVKDAEIDEMFSFTLTEDIFDDVPSSKNQKRSGSTRQKFGSKRGRVGRPPGPAKKKRGPKPKVTRAKTSERGKTAVRKEDGAKGRCRPSKKSEKNKWEPRLKAIRDLRKKRRRDIKKLGSRVKRIERMQKLKRWTIRNILRSRRRYRTKSERLSERVAITLERIVCGSGKVKSFSRQMLGNKRAAKGRPSNTPSKGPEHRRKWLKCFYCSKQLLGKNNRKKHHETMHPEMLRAVMEERRKKYYKKQRALIQKARETGEGPQWVLKRTQGGNKCTSNRSVICEECGEVVLQYNLSKHRRQHDSNRPVNKCPLCPESFAIGYFLWHHFTQVHLNHDLYQMSREKGMKRGFNYGRSREKTEQDPICEICGQTFFCIPSLKRHVENMHTVEEKKFSCHVCARTFKTKDSKDAHVRQIHEGLDFRCDICNRKTQSRGKLWRHKVEHHGMSELPPPEGLNVMECQYCDEKLIRMDPHVKQRHPEKFNEYILQKKSSNSKNRTETRRKKGMMHKREMRRKWLEEGILIQTWVAKRKPKKCPMCGLEVTKSVDWPAHMRDTHGVTIDKVYDKNRDLSKLEAKWICPASGCEESFKLSSDLKRHASSSHNDLEKGLQREGHVEFFWGEGDIKYKFFRCKLCYGVESIKEFGRDILHSMDEMSIHFLLNHKEIYKRLKGELDPDLEENEALASKFESITVACDHCKEECLGDDELREHMAELHPDECWRCPEEGCFRIILNPEELERHFIKSHSTQIAPEGNNGEIPGGPAVSNSVDGGEFKVSNKVKLEVEIKQEPVAGTSRRGESEAPAKSTSKQKGRPPAKKSAAHRAKADKSSGSNKGRKVKPKVEVDDDDGNASFLRRSSRSGKKKRYDDFESDIDDSD